MFVTTFLRSMPEGAKPRRGYQRLIGSGQVPGEKATFSAERGARERVKSWRDAAEVLDLGMAAVLKVPEVHAGDASGVQMCLVVVCRIASRALSPAMLIEGIKLSCASFTALRRAALCCSGFRSASFPRRGGCHFAVRCCLYLGSASSCAAIKKKREGGGHATVPRTAASHLLAS